MATVDSTVPSIWSMGFLTRLRSFFGSSTQSSDEAPARAVVEDDELLVRFIFDRKHIDKSHSTVKPEAFLPHGSPLATSVFRTAGINDAQIWEIANDIAAKRSRSYKGRADFLAQTLHGTPLKLDADDDPPRHANIVGWPTEKADQLLLALGLASDATLVYPLQA
jgi:hypothetical protein